MRAETHRAAGRGLQASGVIGRLAGGHRGDGGFVCGGRRSDGRPVLGLRHNLAHPLEPPLGAMGTFPDAARRSPVRPSLKADVQLVVHLAEPPVLPWALRRQTAWYRPEYPVRARIGAGPPIRTRAGHHEIMQNPNLMQEYSIKSGTSQKNWARLRP